MSKKLFCFGYGYTAGFLANLLKPQGWKIAGTTTDPEKKDYLKKCGVAAMLFDHNHAITDPFGAFSDVTHLLLSVPPNADGDPVFAAHGEDLAKMKNIEWVGYLSTTAVYGNQDGNWVDEATPPAPTSRRGSLRLKAEEQWRGLQQAGDFPVHVFRLAGIYGPGRSAIDAVRAGTARRIDKPGHVFNRVHVADIAKTLTASMHKPSPGSIYNLADDEPSSSTDVISFACNLVGADPPPVQMFEGSEMAPIVRSFYKDNKRVKNDKIKRDLGIALAYPGYRTGLQACLDIAEDTAALLRFEQAEVGTG